MLQQQREYTILPQRESDGDDYDLDYNKKPCCFYVTVALLAIVICGGCAALIAGIVWKDELNSSLSRYWPNGNLSLWAELIESASTMKPGKTHAPETNLTTAANHLSSTEKVHGSSNITSTTPKTPQASNSSDWDLEAINERNIGEKFAEAMRQVEKEMERISGIHQAELVIPAFMLVFFLSMMAVISLCCCIMSKQREKRQRKLLGKFITDLQTGDQKTVLLGKDEDF